MIFRPFFKIEARDLNGNVVCCGKTNDEETYNKVHDELIKNGYRVWSAQSVPCSRFGGSL